MFRFDRLSFARRLRITGFLALLLAAVPALGQPVDVDPEAAAALLEELGDDYQVLTLSDGYLLQPADREADFRAIEVKAGSVAVDGETVTADQLRDLVGDAAETILRAAELGSAESSAAKELRTRIERLAEEQRLKTEEMEELVRAQELEAEEERDSRADALDERRRGNERRDERRRGRRGSVRTDTRVSFGSSLTVEDNETSRDVVVLGGSLDVEGKVRGDAVVVGGSAEIRGEVTGTVTAVGGSISLGPGARIEGDAISIGGAVHRDPTADVLGEVTEVSLAPGFDLDDMWDGVWVPHWHLDWFDFGFGELAGRIGNTVLLTLVLLLVVLLLPRQTAGVCERARREPWKAALVGLLAEVLLVILGLPVLIIMVAILAITIVGIPFAVLLPIFAALAFACVLWMGLAGVAQACGHRLEHRFDWHGLSPYLLVMLGVALIQGWWILGEALGFFGGPLRFLAWMVLLFGFLVKYVAWTTGLGAILLHYLSPAPGMTRPVPATPVDPPGFVPPPPAPTGWEDTAVSKESEERVFDPDKEYLEAGPAAPPPPEPPPEPVDLTDEDYLEAGPPPPAPPEPVAEPPDLTDEDYHEAGVDGESEEEPAEEPKG